VNVTLSRREREALHWTILTLPIITIWVTIFLVGLVANAFFSILVMFFLAWLLAFLLDPVVSRLVERLRFLSRGVAAALVFVAVVVLAITLLAAVASSAISSLTEILGNASTIDDAVAKLVAPVQTQIDHLGFDINLSVAASDLVRQVSANANELLTSLVSSGLALFSEGTTIIFIAVVFVANKGRFLRFTRRLVPDDQTPFYQEFVEATSRSFGGFVRGQFGLAGLYGIIVGALAVVFGVPFAALAGLLTTTLQSVPYFGQLVSWIPLMAITLVFRPDILIPVAVVLSVLLLVVQNLVTPRVMGNAVGLNPILVLAAVFIGAQVAGPIGAVFGVPVLAVVVSLFDSWLDRRRPDPEFEPELKEHEQEGPLERLMHHEHRAPHEAPESGAAAEPLATAAPADGQAGPPRPRRGRAKASA
jgi:predicted PurR-regulated permease PerM